MSQSTLFQPDTSVVTKPKFDDQLIEYRSLNRAAVMSVVLASLGLLGFFFQALLALPVAGLLMGISGYRTIRRYPEEYTGLRLANFGIVASLLALVGGIGCHVYDYTTELPPGHERVSFSELQPEGFQRGIPKRAIELNEKKIFIKGFMHPGVAGVGKTDKFVLVPDMGTCCFGGQPKPTDMILVHTDEASKVAYAPRMIKLGGDFHIGRPENFGDVKNVLYRMEVQHAQ